MNILSTLIILSLIVEYITYMLLQADLISPLVDKVKNLNAFFDSLLSCGYCTSFWITLLVYSGFSCLSVESLSFVSLTTFDFILNFCIGIILTHRLSNLIHGGIDKYLDKSYDKRYHSSWDSFKSKGD